MWSHELVLQGTNRCADFAKSSTDSCSRPSDHAGVDFSRDGHGCNTWKALEGKLQDVESEEQQADILQRLVGRRQDEIRKTAAQKTNELNALT